MDKMNLRAAMRRGNISERTFTLHIGNGYRDTSRNTAQGMLDVTTCAGIIGNHCYCPVAAGQMERVLDDLICVSYISSPVGVAQTVSALRAAGVAGKIRVCAEYSEGDVVGLYDC